MATANQCYATKSGINCEGKGKCIKVHQMIEDIKQRCSHKTLDDLLQEQPERTTNTGARLSRALPLPSPIPGPSRPATGGPWLSLKTKDGPIDSWCQAIWELMSSKGLRPEEHIEKDKRFQSMFHNSSSGQSYHLWRLPLTNMSRPGDNYSKQRPNNEDISVTFIHVTTEEGIGGILKDKRIKSMNEPSGKQWSTIYGQACLIHKGRRHPGHQDSVQRIQDGKGAVRHRSGDAGLRTPENAEPRQLRCRTEPHHGQSQHNHPQQIQQALGHE